MPEPEYKMTLRIPDETTVYEEFVGHPVGRGEQIAENTFEGYAHPENCIDCITNPEKAKLIHAGEEAHAAALEQLQSFFEEPIPLAIATNIVGSVHFALDRVMKARLKELGFG